jgi:agmatinase
MQYLLGSSGGKGVSVPDQQHAKLGSLMATMDQLRKGDIALLGIPFEGMTYNPVGGRGGPEGLRNLLGFYRPYSPELDIDISEVLRIADLGNIDVEPLSYEETFKRTHHVVTEILKKEWVPIIFGGSHSITEGTIKAFSDFYDRKIGVLWLDAHPDTMEEYHGDAHYCGCPALRLIEGGYVKPKNIVHLGLRSFHHSKAAILKAKTIGLDLVLMEDIRKNGVDKTLKEALARVKDGTKAFYITMDTDAIEGGFVPGTQAPCPNGFMPFEMMKIIREASMAGAGAMDIVEYAPPLDVRDMTGLILAELVLEMIVGVAYRKKG